MCYTKNVGVFEGGGFRHPFYLSEVLRMKRPFRWCSLLWCLIPLAVAAGMYFLLPLFPRFTEYVITRGLFRAVAFPVEWLMSLFPISVTELVVLLGPPVLLALAVLWIVRLVRRPERKARLGRGLRWIAWGLSLALLVFMVMDGANFSRLPLAQLMDLPDRSYTAEDLYTLTADLAQKASEARAQVPEDGEGCAVLSRPLTEALERGGDGYRALREQYPYLVTGAWRAKPVALSHAWSYTGYTGVYCPWLGEASVNVDIPASELMHTVTHELAHTMGFAKENECNFLAYLACTASGDPDAVYSGLLSAYIYSANALYGADKEAWQQAASQLSAGVRRDLRQRSAYWDSFEGEVMDSSQKVNDTFIKVNGVESGVISYDEMVELLLRYYEQQGWL